MKSYVRNAKMLLIRIMLIHFVTVFTTGIDSCLAQCQATGDVNGDGLALQVADAIYLVKQVKCGIQPATSLHEGDLNGDCAVDEADVEVYECYFSNGLSCFDPYGGYPVSTCCNPGTVLGACVDQNGDCFRRTQVNCNASGGVYMGDNTLCDADGDALPDCWEEGGYDHDGDGLVDVDLPAMGADPMRKDIFVEIDWMGFSIDHHHQPKPIAMNWIETAFLLAPVDNPNGSQGINLHIDYGQGGEWTGGNVIPHESQLSPVWTEFDDIKAVNFDPARVPIFHYCVFGHSFDNTDNGGVSRGIPSNDFVVTLGPSYDPRGTKRMQAGAFMHELGHNLGLFHGGNENHNYKPNYLSVMNYYFSYSGLLYFGQYGNYDFSRFDFPNLDEICLDETVGLNGPPDTDDYGMRFMCLFSPTNWKLRARKACNNPIDWECDAEFGGTCVTAPNHAIDRDASVSVLTGYEDWSNLRYDGGQIGFPTQPINEGKEAANDREVSTDGCLSWSEYQEICVRRGDANSSGGDVPIDIADVTFLVKYVFVPEAPGPFSVDDGDPNGTEDIDISDITYLLNWIFQSGPEPKCY